MLFVCLISCWLSGLPDYLSRVCVASPLSKLIDGLVKNIFTKYSGVLYILASAIFRSLDLLCPFWESRKWTGWKLFACNTRQLHNGWYQHCSLATRKTIRNCLRLQVVAKGKVSKGGCRSWTNLIHNMQEKQQMTAISRPPLGMHIHFTNVM